MRIRCRIETKMPLMAAAAYPQVYYDWEHRRAKGTACGRTECLRLGCKPEEVTEAINTPGKWIVCPREEEPDEPVIQVATETLQEKLDALLEACKPVLPHLWHYDKLCPCDAVSRDIGSLVSAIAKAQPKK